MATHLAERNTQATTEAVEPAAAPEPTSSADSPVELVQLSEQTWRVCDGRAADSRSGYIVGYLQQVDDEFEMLWMRPRPGVVHRHADFDEAVHAIALRLRMYSAA